jgi:uncharacterized C2H2 Zn-finger protein
MSRRTAILHRRKAEVFILRCPTCHLEFTNTPEFATHAMSDVHDSDSPAP